MIIQDIIPSQKRIKQIPFSSPKKLQRANKKVSSKILPALLSALLIVQMFLPIQMSLNPPSIEIQQAQAASDWLDGWDYRTPIEIDNNTEDLTDYQVQITLQGTNSSAANYVDFDKILASGTDIRFTDSDKTTEIDFWIEEWVDTSGSESATVWLEVPSILQAGTKTVYVYYGKANEESASNFDNTFTKDYGESGLVGLWHMDTGSGITAVDSSGEGNNGTFMRAGEPAWVGSDGGQYDNRSDVNFSAGDSLLFDGVDDYINCGNDPSLSITDEITIEAWINPASEKVTDQFDVLSSFSLPDGFVGYQGVAVNADHIFVLDSTNAAHENNNHIRKFLKDGTLIQTKSHTESIIITVNGAIRSGNEVTITANEPHHYNVSDVIYIDGVDNSSFNGGGFTISSVPTSTTFIYNQTGNDANSGNGWLGEIEGIRDWHGYSDGNIIDDKLYVTVCKGVPESIEDSAVLVYDPETLELLESHLLTGRYSCPEGIDKHNGHFWIVYYQPNSSPPNLVDEWDENFNFVASYEIKDEPVPGDGEQTIVWRGDNILVHQHGGHVYEYSFNGSAFTFVRTLIIGGGVPLAKGVNEGEEDIYYQACYSNGDSNVVKRLKYHLNVTSNIVPGHILNKYGGGAGYYFTKYSGSPYDRLRFVFFDEDGAYQAANSVITFEHDVWNHVAVTYDGTVKFYINGVEDVSSTFDKEIKPTTASVNAIIGINGITWPFPGIIDEVRIYNRSLSKNEIYRQYIRSKYTSTQPNATTTFAFRGYDKIFTGITNTISATDYISYSAEPSVSNLVDMTITPASGSVDTSITTWNTSGTYYKKWTEIGDGATGNTSHTIGDLKANTYYTVKVDTARFNTYLSNGSGEISFTYTGGYSSHEFEIEEDATAPTEFDLVSPVNNFWTNDNTPTLSWNASSDTESGLAKYQLYIDEALDKDNIDSSSTSTTPTSALTDGSYTWYIKAIDNAGNSRQSTSTYTIKIDTIVPSLVGAPSFGAITTSSIEVEKPSTVTENGSGLYQWQARRDNTTELGFNVIATTSVVDSSLSENTQYTYDAQFKDNANNLGNYGTTANKYTLADTPTNLIGTAAQNTMDLLADSFPNATADLSGYYFENTATGSNSGWIQTNFWNDTGLICNTSYAYTVKYRNGDGVETNTISLTKFTDSCGGGSTPPGSQNPPEPPTPTSENPKGEFKILINNGNETTNNRTVNLKLSAGSDTTKMIISENSDFKNSIQKPYQETRQWSLSYGDGVKTIYVKFYTKYGIESEIISDSIILDTSQKETILIKPETIIENESVEKTSLPEKDKLTSLPKTSIKENIALNPIVIAKNLKYGSNNNQVINLQDKLKQLNLFPKKIKSNGNFGSITKQAIKEFQKSVGIYPCSIVGPRTRKALNNQEFITNKDYQFTQNLKYNDKGEEVKQLQTRLRDQSFFPYYVKSTGWFGPITQKAVKLFQKFHGIIENGIVGEVVREKLNF